MNIFNVQVSCRVARWYIFKPKIKIGVIFGVSCNGRFWNISWTFGPFYSHLIYLIDIGYLLWYIGKIFPVLVGCTKKNLATLSSLETDL
jgi:hypothetical protein